jgi:hypothetical protein
MGFQIGRREAAFLLATCEGATSAVGTNAKCRDVPDTDAIDG